MDYKKISWKDLLPELKQWKSGAPPEVLASAFGSYPVAISYLLHFWPQFEEYNGMVLRNGFASDNQNLDRESINTWLETLKGNKAAVEAVINHQHILDIHGADNEKPATEEQIIYLGKLLKEMWTAKLAHDFPDRSFVVEFDDTPGAASLSEYEITFYQKH